MTHTDLAPVLSLSLALRARECPVRFCFRCSINSIFLLVRGFTPPSSEPRSSFSSCSRVPSRSRMPGSVLFLSTSPIFLPVCDSIVTNGPISLLLALSTGMDSIFCSDSIVATGRFFFSRGERVRRLASAYSVRFCTSPIFLRARQCLIQLSSILVGNCSWAGKISIVVKIFFWMQI